MKPIIEELGNTDQKAKEELDGVDSEDAINLDDVISGDISKGTGDSDKTLEVPADDISPPKQEQTEMQDIPTPDELKTNGHDGFTLSNVSSQIDGMVNKWFQFAVNMDPEKKDKFLALGERLSEISEMLKTDFQ